jgi:hypothetical protein
MHNPTYQLHPLVGVGVESINADRIAPDGDYTFKEATVAPYRQPDILTYAPREQPILCLAHHGFAKAGHMPLEIASLCCSQ